MPQLLSIRLEKAGEEPNSPLLLPVERMVFSYNRVAGPNALPRLQSKKTPVSEPIVVIFDIGFMTQTIALSGTCSNAIANILRDATLNWQRNAIDEAILDTVNFITPWATFTGNIGPVKLKKTERLSQDHWEFQTTFLVKQTTYV